MKWINVNDQLPPDGENDECGEYYLVWLGKYGWSRAMYKHGRWCGNYTSAIMLPITHWAKVVSPE